MKIYQVSFTLGIDTVRFQIVAAGKNISEVRRSVIQLVIGLSGKRPRHLLANAIVFGADEKGTSLKKIRKK